MIVQLNLSALRETRWYEYLIRFALGGAMTVIAGLITDHFGPIVGGLFLAFPAIFPASATLIEKHEGQKKERGDCPPGFRGTDAAALDAAERHFDGAHHGKAHGAKCRQRRARTSFSAQYFG